MKFSFFVVLVCFGVSALSKPTPNQVDKFSYIMSTLTRPYSGAYDRIQTETASHYKTFQTLLTSGLSGYLGSQEESEDTKPANTPKILKEKNLDDSEFLIDEEDANSGSFRSLQSLTCAGNSRSVNTRVNIYKCNGVEVTRANYDDLDGVNCTISTETKSLCYCPYDYYGDRCQRLNEFSCEIERVSHPENCQGTDSFAYVYSFNGVPPCHKVQAGDKVVFKTKAICRPLNAQYDFEGVKHSKYEVIQQPTINPSPFTYAINNDRLRITNPPSPVLQFISFTNWKKMSDPIIFSTSLIPSQMAGDDEITTTIDFKPSLAQSATSGRYYFELSISTNDTPRLATRSYNGGFFEQEGYQEPSPAPKTNKTLIIVLSVLGGVLLIGLIVGYRFYQKRKEQKERESVEAAPLVGTE